MNTSASGIGIKMAKGAAWTVSSRFAVQGIGLVSTVILARLLVPEDFGLVALATMLAAALSVLSELGFDIVLIQNQNAGRRYYDTAWTLSIIRNGVIAGAMILIAATVAVFFEEPRLESIFYWLALATIVTGFQNIAVVNFRKDLNFHKDFAFMVAPKLGTFAITVPLAFLWRDYWALVAGITVGAFIRVALGYLMQPYRPRLSLDKWRPIMAFSKWLLINNILGFAYGKSDNFVIGKIVGAQSLGLYAIAFEIATLPISAIMAPIRRVLLPGFAKMADDLETLRAGYLDVLSLALLIGAPAVAGIGLIAEPLVKLALGEKWVDSIPIIQVLAVHGLLIILGTGNTAVYLTLGKPYLGTIVVGCGYVVMLPLLIWGVDLAGAYGAALAVTTATGVIVIISVVLICRVLRLRVIQLIRRSWRPYAAVAIMAITLIDVQSRWPVVHTLPAQALWLAASVATGAATYVGVELGLWCLSGFPDGAERRSLHAVRIAVTKVKAALSR